MNRKQDAFAKCHPIVQIGFFAAVILTTMFVNHPFILGISFLGAIIYNVILRGFWNVIKFQILFSIPIFVVVAFINPMFSHYGVTVIFYMKTGPVTLEAIVYGLVLASMLWISILWFSNFNKVMTTDRFVYLFGRIVPTISLVLSMVFRFVPRFTRQLKVIRNGQKCIGRDTSGQNIIKKISYGIKELSMLITWSLESGIQTADSMKARGYGLGKRSAYAIFSFSNRDKVSLVLLLLGYVGCMAGFFKGYSFAQYDPRIVIQGYPFSLTGVITYVLWFLLCMYPVELYLYDDILKRIQKRRVRQGRTTVWYIQEAANGKVRKTTAMKE